MTCINQLVRLTRYSHYLPPTTNSNPNIHKVKKINEKCPNCINDIEIDEIYPSDLFHLVSADSGTMR